MSILKRFENSTSGEAEAVLVREFISMKKHRESLIGQVSAYLIPVIDDTTGAFRLEIDPSKQEAVKALYIDIAVADVEIIRLNAKIEALDQLYARIEDPDTSLSLLRKKTTKASR